VVRDTAQNRLPDAFVGIGAENQQISACGLRRAEQCRAYGVIRWDWRVDGRVNAMPPEVTLQLLCLIDGSLLSADRKNVDRFCGAQER
jgi:hypothetical protein